MLEVGEMFEVGKMVVYPAHGVGLIESLETKEISGDKHQFYIMRMLGNDMTIMIPANNIQNIGLRPIITKTELDKVYEIFQHPELFSQEQTWKRRYREYTDKLKTGSIYDLAEVLRDLFLLKHKKGLSFGERKLFDQAKELIVKEISLLKNKSEEDIAEEVELVLAEK